MTSLPQRNAALVRRFLTDVVAGEDQDAFEAFVAEDVVDHNLVFGGEQPHERDWGFAPSVLAAAGDIDVEVEQLVSADDSVAVRATVSGTYHDSLRNLALSGASLDVAYVWFYRIEDGQIAEVWSLPDALGIVQQLTGNDRQPIHGGQL